MAPTPSSPGTPEPASFDRELNALRDRLRSARAERGACPPWDDLRDDLLPGGASRPGRADRLAHRDLCPYCDAHVQEWERSVDRTSDTLSAIEKGVARGVVAGARRLVGLAGPAAPAPAESTPEPPSPGAAPPPRAETPVAPPPMPMPMYVPPPSPPPARPAPRATPAAARSAPVPAPSPAGPLRLLVVEIDFEERIPQSVFLCAAVLEAEVAVVARIESMAGDPDLDTVCGVIFAGGREPADWPAAVRRARDLVPARPIVVLATPGCEPPGGARRALGAILVSADDPAERLLLALDARLR